MKWIAAVLYVSLFTVISAFSCSKNVTAKAKADLKGNWELTTISGMIGVTTVAPNTGNTCTFTDDEFRQYENGDLKLTTTYTITEINGNLVTGYFGDTSNSQIHAVFTVTGGTGLSVDFGSAVDLPVYRYIKK